MILGVYMHVVRHWKSLKINGRRYNVYCEVQNVCFRVGLVVQDHVKVAVGVRQQWHT